VGKKKAPKRGRRIENKPMSSQSDETDQDEDLIDFSSGEGLYTRYSDRKAENTKEKVDGGFQKKAK